jgi:hypothetical protein
MNKKALISAFGGVAFLIIGARAYHQKSAKEDPNAHYLLAGKHDVAVGKSDHRIHGVQAEEPSILKTIEGDDRQVLTADSFKRIPSDIKELKTDLANLKALLDGHETRRENITPKDYSKLSLEVIRNIIADQINRSKDINDKRQPHLEHLMKTAITYKQHFELYLRVLDDIENRIAILKDDPKDVEKDTGLTQTEIKGILNSINNTVPNVIQINQYAPSP